MYADEIMHLIIINISTGVQEFSEQEWKGSFLNVTVARESFMEKLKREREEEGRKKQNQVHPLILNNLL